MNTLFRADPLANFVALFVALFFLLILIYCVGYFRGLAGRGRFIVLSLATFAASLGVVYSDNLLLLLVFWGFLGALLFLLIDLRGSERAALTAKKTLVIVGGTDALMLLGFGLVWKLVPQADFTALSLSSLQLDPSNGAALAAFLCLAAGALAKAGAMPFHTWVPDTAEDAPIPVTAFLPASLDKLLGIYLLSRLMLEVFPMTPALQNVAMGFGATTILLAVMMALVQHDMRRLLGYHAVSQVGYMILGLGCGNPLGIAGAFFHMLNNALYKSSLFFCAGNVEREAGSMDLERLGGLSRRMPWTFASFLVSSLAISGIPPLNGFYSKWLIYQGVIETSPTSGGLWAAWLIAALFGTALTLASFMKLLHAVFLGQPNPALPDRPSRRKDVSPWMWIPPVVLSVLSIIFGIFATSIPLPWFILPAVPGELPVTAIWEAWPATILLLGGVTFGLLLYLLAGISRIRKVPAFVGGEVLAEFPEMRVSGADFYRTIQQMKPFAGIYRAAEAKRFDPYEAGKRLCLAGSRVLGEMHNGLLPRYLVWCLVGFLIILLALLR